LRPQPRRTASLGWHIFCTAGGVIAIALLIGRAYPLIAVLLSIFVIGCSGVSLLLARNE
jgi:hypothetical protein